MTSSGGVSRVAKGADCKSAAVWLRRFESFFPHQFKNRPEIVFRAIFLFGATAASLSLAGIEKVIALVLNGDCLQNQTVSGIGQTAEFGRL